MAPIHSSKERLEKLLGEIAAEPADARRERWQGLFDRLVSANADRLVLFGAGQFGRWCLARLRAAGIEPCCFSDNRKELWGARVDGLEVLSPLQAVERYGQVACFVVTIYNGSEAREQLRRLGCRGVVAAPILFWKYPSHFMPDLGIDSPDRLVGEVEQIRRCFALLSDEASRHEFCSQLEWRYWMRPEFLPIPKDQGELYFPADLVTQNEQEVVVDGGAFDGDSVRSLLRRGQKFLHLYALEPDRANLAALTDSLRELPGEQRDRVTAWPYALGDTDGEVSFVETHDIGSRVSASDKSVVIESRRLDSLPWQHAPTYIKLDIEGSEMLALTGGRDLLKREMPVLAVCLYHRTQHLWQIPNLIDSLAPGYSFYLRRYAEDCWEEVCYAVPAGRLPRHAQHS